MADESTGGSGTTGNTTETGAQTGDGAGTSNGTTALSGGELGSGSSAGTGAVTHDWIPQDYQSKEWVQNILKTADPKVELFKQFENQATLIGRKAPEKPGDNATPEQISKWREFTGVPNDPKAYEIKNAEWGDEDKAYGEYLTATRPETFIEGLKGEAHKLGLTPDQLNGAIQAYDKLFVQHHKEFLNAEIEKEKALETNFAELAAKTFGDKKDEVINVSTKFIKEVVPESVKPFLAKLDTDQAIPANEVLIALSGLMHGVYEKYGKEDSSFDSKATAVAGNDALARARELSDDPRYNNITHPEHKQIRKQVDDLYRQAAGIK